MPTLKHYINALANSGHMGGYRTIVTTSAGTQGNHIICAGLSNTTEGGRTSQYAKNWVMAVENAGSTQATDIPMGTVRQVNRDGFLVATGQLSLNASWATGLAGSGKTWELYFKLPPMASTGPDRGFRECINDALADMWVEDYINISGVTGQTDYPLSLTTNYWLRDNGRIAGIREPRPNATDPWKMATHRWSIYPDGQNMVLYMPSAPYSTGDTFSLKVYRPANSLLNLTGSFVDQSSPTAGLVDLDDEAIPGVNELCAVALYYCYLEMARNGPAGEVDYWEKKAETQRMRSAMHQFGMQPPGSIGQEDGKPMRFSGGGNLSAFR